MNKTNNIPSKRRQNLVSDIWKIIKTIVVIALLVLIRYAVALPMFDFSKIEITPVLFDLTKNDVLTIANIKEPTNIFTVDLKIIEKKLVSDLRIKSAKVSYKLPGILHISIEENKPLIYIASKYAFLEIDSNYKIIKISKSITNSEIPILSGVNEEHSFVGDDIKSPVSKDIINFLKDLPIETKEIISEVIINNNIVHLFTLNKTKIILGEVSSIRSKAENFDIVTKQIKDRNLAVEYVDLSYDRPFIKVKKDDLTKKIGGAGI